MPDMIRHPEGLEKMDSGPDFHRGKLQAESRVPVKTRIKQNCENPNFR